MSILRWVIPAALIVMIMTADEQYIGVFALALAIFAAAALLYVRHEGHEL